MASKRNKSNRISWEDYEDMSGKGIRREKRKAKRRKNKSNLNEYCAGNVEDWDDYMETFEQTEKMNKDLS